MAQKYADPSTERLLSGRTMADVMRGGATGLRGVVVAAADAGGTSVNFNPHDTSQVAINICDQGGNARHTMTLGQFTADNMTRAMAIASTQVEGQDIESIRERAAVAFEELAKMSNSNMQRVPVKSKKLTAPAQTDEEETQELLANLQRESQHPPTERIDRNYSPMAAFGLKKQTIPPAQTTMANTHKSGPPQKLLYFEKEGIGTVPAFFHDAIVSVSRKESDNPEESGFIVLVYDLRFEQNAARWFPPSNDQYQRPWAVQISDDSRLYLVHTTGFQYVYDNSEYCILLVERALRAPPEEQ